MADYPLTPNYRSRRESQVPGSRRTLFRSNLGTPLGDGLLRQEDSVQAAAREYQRVGETHYRFGRLTEAAEALGEAVERFADIGDTAGTIVCLLGLGRARRDLGELDHATAQFERALDLAREQNDAGSEADALNLLAGALSSRGDYVAAFERLDEALEIAARKGLKERHANILSNVGSLHTKIGDYPRALESLKAAYELVARVAPGTRSEAINLISLGHLYREMGEPHKAREFYALAREVGRKTDDHMVELVSLNSLANVFSLLGEWAHAGDLYREALERSREYGVRQYEIDNLDGLGQVHAARGEYTQARDVHGQALDIAGEIGDSEGEVDALINLGRDYLELKDPATARDRLEEGLQLAKAIEARRAVYLAHSLLSRTCEEIGDLALALQHEREFHRMEKTVFNLESERRSKQLAVQFELERSRHEAEAYRLEVLQQAHEEAEARVLERTRELEESQLEIVSRLAIAAEYRDDDTGEHTRRVGRSAAAVARALGWPEDDAQLLSAAARLHDVGKIGVRDAVLLKPGALEMDEFDVMRAHTTIGASILSGGQSRLLRMAEEISLAHHERWDGRGYPLGLAGEHIPIAARIVAVADVLDALTHERPYKRAWPTKEALAELQRQSGSQFDPKVVAACLEVVRNNASVAETEDDPRRARGGGEQAKESVTYDVAGLGKHFDQVLEQRTRELEEARRSAELAARQMTEMAYSDPLTGLKNRRAFEDDLEAALLRAERHGDRVGVLTVDIDALKPTNDTLGHDVGDALLREYATCLSERLSGIGRVYRVGGDEFSAILASSQVSEVGDVMSQVEQALSHVRDAGFEIVGASAGLAFYPDEARSSADLTRLSDQRMYRDKMERRKAREARTN